jgi:Tfp pilus assembly protein PilX
MPAPSPLIIGHTALVVSRGRRGGFALLVTITLLAFIVLLLVSLASLTRVETQVAGNSQQLAQARQNALMALNLALGQLQKHAGPDQRVTARADVQPLATSAAPSPYPTTDPASGENLGEATATLLPKIDTYWRASRNRQWTGAWKNGNGNAYDKETPSGVNPVPVLQSWLVSGNENIGNTYKPTDAISGLTTAKTALDKILDAAGKPHRLLVKASAGVATAADLDRAVTAPEIEIRSAETPGNSGTDTPIGHYAWWVGDEGVKARANLVDPYAATGTATANLTRRQSAQRPAIEAMTASGTDGLAPLAPPSALTALADFQTSLGKVFSPSQLGLVNAAATLPADLKTRFHDLSVSSRGVLADTKNGGLKTDLSYILGQTSLADFRTTLRAAYGTNDVAPLANAYTPILTPATTRYATLPANASTTFPYDGGVGILGNTATWEQLWSFHHLGSLASASPAGAFDSSGRAVSRRQTPTQHGVHPLVVQAKLFYRLRIVGGGVGGDGVNRTGIIYVDTIPLAVLANPYPVDLAPADYQLVINGAGPALVFGSTDTPSDVAVDYATKAFPAGDPIYNGGIRLVLRTKGIAAGEAQIFTIDPDPAVNPTIDSGDRLLVANGIDTRLVVMKNEYDPVPALTYNTGKSIPAAPISRAALRSTPGQLNTVLYMDNTTATSPTAQGHQNLIQFIRFQSYSVDLLTGSNAFLIVDPLATDIRQGGGYIMAVAQPPTSDNPVTTNPVRLFSHLQAPFYQFNYRGLTSTNVGVPLFGGIQGVVETARTFSKNGSTGSAGDTPNLWLAANLLRPSGSMTKTRWGIVNIGEQQQQTVPPASIGGSLASDIGFKNFLYDLPRVGRSVSSLGQLQHLDPSGLIPPGVTNFDSSATVRSPITVNGWQVNYPIANSYPHPRVLRQDVFGVLPEHGYHYDGSYLWNDALWDRFYFSTYPQAGSFDFGADRLTNSRYRPFRDSSTVPWDEESAFRGDGNPATVANSRIAAQNLMVEGAFNINSTSVEAWKAVFSSLKNIPVGNETAPNAPYSRTLTPDALSASTGAATGVSPNSWNGFRDLSRTEIQKLAEEMVVEVRKRGPFLSLADFVNRRLIAGRITTAATTGDPLRLGLSGALQAALDRAVNLDGNIDSMFRVQAKGFVSMTNTSSTVNHNAMRDYDYRMSTALAGFPGYTLQGDVLSALAPTLSARSDTFTIRTYGDSVNPSTGEVTGRAWCEAVVQRTPDYVVSSGAGGIAPHEIPAASTTNASFGRRFQIVSFRWLSAEDI